ncbi:MAG: anthranilate phosphoribosyltransferase [Thermoleophilia bacterium]|nr:anthranilate phosphoribosyltransferase [Thermoleophilia bacterium]
MSGTVGVNASSVGAGTLALVLRQLAEGRDLDRCQAADALTFIAEGQVEEAQLAAFLMGLRVKGETADEVAGLLETMRRLVVPVETPYRSQLVDIVGTGGDGLGTFNISTTAAFVAAGAGLRVAKHGNRAASSRCGSADVLEALGVRIDLSPEQVRQCIERVGIGFMLATAHHPAMSKVARVRKVLGVRTVFNLLGPLTNPAGALRQVIGVSSPEYLRVLAEALARVGCKHALVVCGEAGMDELSVTGPTQVVEVRDGVVAGDYLLEPESLGITRCDLSALAGGTPAENAAITRAILCGERGPRRDVVLLNAGAALYVGGAAPNIGEGMILAEKAIDNGQAAAVLDLMVRITNELACERDKQGNGKQTDGERGVFDATLVS